MIAAEEIEGLLDKEISIEQKREMENQAEIDRVIDEICALFNRKQLGEDMDSTISISQMHGVPP
ncbi:hypothetical protein L195_g052832 [Trifolium pratense]|uniref:Uncharacterized protein n=1 Tax=Trifolium pratense TaxID=57577 RepID=A0A2K3K7C3_TRIPR|nr:hypothetical protein L195_g052832 [Trifolium pratense]